MAITIDYSTNVISIPRADMLDVTAGGPTEIRQLNINDLRIELGDIQDGEEGIPYLTTHSHTPPLTIAGVTLARVVEILDPYTIEFENGSYNVNIVGGNSNISDVTVKNTVGVNTSNSAGLQDPFALQAAAFGMGQVAINPNAISTGTTFPFGTRSFPVNNVADALSIANLRGIRRILILDDITLDSGDFSDGFNFEGDNSNISVTLDDPTNITNCTFVNMAITGTLDGQNTLERCSVTDLNMLTGTMRHCGIRGTVTLGIGGLASFIDCYSLVAGSGPGEFSIVDLGGTQTTDLVVRNWSGGLEIINCSDQQAASSVDILSGRFVLGSTITDGTFVIRGICHIEDSSGSGVTLIDNTTTSQAIRSRKHLTNRLETNPVTGIATLYDDDGVTVLETSQLSEDVGATQTYRGQGAERRDGFAAP